MCNETINEFPVFLFNFNQSIQHIDQIRRQKLRKTTTDYKIQKGQLQKQNTSVFLQQQHHNYYQQKIALLQQDIKHLKSCKQVSEGQIQRLSSQLQIQAQAHQRKMVSIQQYYSISIQQVLNNFQINTWNKAKDLSRQIQSDHFLLQQQVKLQIKQLQEQDSQFVNLSKSKQLIQIQILKEKIQGNSRRKFY